VPNAFWIDSVEKDRVYLSPSEVNHLKVLRARIGEKGYFYRFQLEKLSKRETTGKLLSVEHVSRDMKKLTILVAATKWPRLRLVVEKAVELKRQA